MLIQGPITPASFLHSTWEFFDINVPGWLWSFFNINMPGWWIKVILYGTITMGNRHQGFSTGLASSILLGCTITHSNISEVIRQDLTQFQTTGHEDAKKTPKRTRVRAQHMLLHSLLWYPRKLAHSNWQWIGLVWFERFKLKMSKTKPFKKIEF